MGRIVIELTDRCNLRCGHCPDGRHGGKGDVPMAVIETVLAEAKSYGFDELAFTGGEPTIHKRFFEVIEKASKAAYSWGFVSNGWNFAKIYTTLLRHRDHFAGITFSLDGAREKTHDALRGRGSYRRVLQAMSICVFKDIPFASNMVVTRKNYTELAEQVDLAARLGSRGVRFGHFIPTSCEDRGLALSSEERRSVDETVWQLQRTAAVSVAMAPGYFTAELFPCAPLQMQELNIDWRGNVTKCCHLSGYGNGVGGDDIVGNLTEIGFAEALARLAEANEEFRRDKLARQASGELHEADYFPCLYCTQYFKKMGTTVGIPAQELAASARAAQVSGA